jgi:hypothetical protein
LQQEFGVLLEAAGPVRKRKRGHCAAEDALRRIAVGRKNWLFAGSDTAGRTAAILFSLIASCQRHPVDPFAYVRDVLTRIASHPHNRLGELLPGRWRSLA